jgi:uncharacterized protein YneR
MHLTVTDPAVEWIKKELNLHAGDAVRFFARYGGCGSVQAGFSLGMHKQKPSEIGLSYEKSDILFYLEKEDLWYLDERDIRVDYDASQDEVQFVVGNGIAQ